MPLRGKISNPDPQARIIVNEARVDPHRPSRLTEIVERHPEETVGIIRQWMYAE